MRRTAWRTIATFMVGALLAVIPMLAPTIAAPAGAYPATVCATLQVSTTTPSVGQTITVTGVNFLPGAEVVLKLKPAAGNTTADDTIYTLATVVSDSNGSFTTKVTIPEATTSKESFVLYAATGAPNDSVCPADPRVDLEIAAAGAANNDNPDATSSGAPGATAFTGVNVLLLVLIAAGLIAVGVFFTRRGKVSVDPLR